MYTYIYYFRVLAYALGGIAVSAALATTAFAQADTERRIPSVPDVTITESSLTEEGRTLTATFTVSGDGSILPGVRYGIVLYSTSTDGQLTLVDAGVADTTFDIKAREMVSRTMTYTPPQRLEGTYLVTLEVRNAADFILDRRVFGPRNFGFSGEVVPLTISDCMFHNLQSVGEIRCGIANLGAEERAIQASVSVHEQGAFGKEIGTATRDLTLLPGTVEQVDFTGLASELAGGTYTAVISLLDPDTKAVLHREILTEDVGEPTPKIKSVFFEKGGDGQTTVNVATNFGSRDFSFRISSERAGSKCDGLTAPFSGIPTVIPITLCPSEDITVELLSEDGSVLDAETVRFPGEDPLSFMAHNDRADMYLYTGIILLSLLGVLLLLRRGPQKTLMMLALGFVFFAPGIADASTYVSLYSFGSDGNNSGGATVNLNDYATTEVRIVASADAYCGSQQGGTPGGTDAQACVHDVCVDQSNTGDPSSSYATVDVTLIKQGDGSWRNQATNVVFPVSINVNSSAYGSCDGIPIIGGAGGLYYSVSLPNLSANNDLAEIGTLQQGQIVSFSGSFRNSGSVDVSSSFNSNFSYCWGLESGTCDVNNDGNFGGLGGHIFQGALDAGDTRPHTSGGAGLFLNQTGALTVRHCVDSTEQIGETNESRGDNCKTRQFNVTGAPVYSCTGSIPANAQSFGADEETGLTVNTPWTYSATDGEPTPKCQYTCQGGYIWNGSSCNLAPPPVYSCNGSIPANAAEWDAEERDSVPQFTSWSYANPDTVTKCEFRCNNGYVWNGSSCQLAAFMCTGLIPSGGERWDAEEETGLSSNTPWSYSNLDNITKCQYGWINLTADINPTVNGVLEVGQNVTFNGQVRNSGDLSVTNPFSDNFTYCWGVGCNPAIQIGGHIAKATPFAAGATSNDTSASLNLSNTGRLRVQHCIDSLGQVSESNETVADNCRTSDFDVLAAPSSQPNLAADSPITANGTLQQGQNVSFSGTFRNDSSVNVTSGFSSNFSHCWGDANACQVWNDGAFNFGLLGGHIPQAALSAGQPRSHNSPASLNLSQQGPLTVRHCADSQEIIPESNENRADNCKTTTFTVDAAPPQTLTLTINPASRQANPVTGTATTTLSWSGSNFPGGVNDCFVQQSSSIFMSPVTTIGSGFQPTGSTGHFQTPGTQYYRVSCPTQGVNSNVASFTVTAPPQPNITSRIDPLLVSGSLTQGQTVTFRGEAQNTSGFPLTVSFYSDFSFRWGTSGFWTRFGPYINHPYSVGAPFATDAITSHVSSGLPLDNGGTLQIQYCVDSLWQITESNEGDNCRIATFNVTTTQNLVSNIDPTVNGALIQGNSVTFSGQVRNAGAVSVTQQFSDRFYACWGVGCKPSPIGVDIAKTVPFAVNATQDDLSAPFPLVNSGSLTVEHCVDSLGQVGETTEADNCRSTVFTVSVGPNLTATNVNPVGDPIFVDPTSVTFSGTVQNAGAPTQAGQQFWADLEIDWNQANCAAASPEQSFTTGGPWDGVAAGWSANVSATLRSDTSPQSQLRNGNHCYRMIVDRGNFVPEANEGDNAAPWQPFEIANLGECEDGVDNDVPPDGLIDDEDDNCGGGGPNENGRCTGSIPSSMVRHDAEEEAGLSTNLPWDYAPTDTSRKCQYRCSDPNARFVGGNCITGTITADPNLIPSGGSSMLEWEVFGDTSSLTCEVTDGVKAVFPGPSGAKVDTGPLFAATTYTLGCDNVPLDSATVSLYPPPTLTPNPRVVDLGGSSELTYNLNGNTGCVLTGGGLNIPLDDSVQTGTREVNGIRGTTTYTINCSGSTGSATVELREIGRET